MARGTQSETTPQVNIKRILKVTGGGTLDLFLKVQHLDHELAFVHAVMNIPFSDLEINFFLE